MILSNKAIFNRRPKRKGFVVSTELIAVVTVAVIGLVSGWGQIRDAVNSEFDDVSQAITSINQSFRLSGASNGNGDGSAGSQFQDASEGQSRRQRRGRDQGRFGQFGRRGLSERLANPAQTFAGGMEIQGGKED